MIHGRIECPKCGDIQAQCRCFSHENAVHYALCAGCVNSKEETPSGSQEPLYQIKSVERKIIGDALVLDIHLEVKAPIQFILSNLSIKGK